jgi:hypothetical protein
MNTAMNVLVFAVLFGGAPERVFGVVRAGVPAGVMSLPDRPRLTGSEAGLEARPRATGP